MVGFLLFFLAGVFILLNVVIDEKKVRLCCRG